MRKHQPRAPDRRHVLILFTRAAPRIKSKRFPIDVPFYPYIFYTHSATYKKQGASDRHPVPSLYFLYAHYYRFPADVSSYFHTEQSSAYEKQEASTYLYTSFGYSTKPFSCKFIN
jgi:hypothetical protein